MTKAGLSLVLGGLLVHAVFSQLVATGFAAVFSAAGASATAASSVTSKISGVKLAPNSSLSLR